VDALAAETPDGSSAGEEPPEHVRDATALFDRSTVVRFVAFWIIGPSVATALSYVAFVALPLAGT
jgi:PiT family inorganic phosphate transporter